MILRRGAALVITAAIVLTILRLTDTIDWSWWRVLSPLWFPVLSLGMMFCLIGVLILGSEHWVRD